MNFNNWKRIMLKLSGEVLIGKQDYGIDPDKVISIADDITQVHKKGKEISKLNCSEFNTMIFFDYVKPYCSI